jgi:DNA primase
MSLIEKLAAEDFTLERDGNRFLRAVEHTSLVIDTKKDLFYWNSKNLSGDSIAYLIKVRGYSYAKATETVKKYPSEYIPQTSIETKEEVTTSVGLVDLFFEIGKNYRDYWYTKRGYTDATIDKFKLGYTGTWYTIPIFDNGDFVNFQIRKDTPKIIKHWYRGVGPHPFNFGVLNFSNWVIIAEGPADAIMLRQYNLPGISQTGGSSYWNKDWNKLLLGKRRIFIVYDNDSAGKIHAKKLGEVFGKKARIYTFSDFDEKFDITDYFKLGHTADDFMDLVEEKGQYEYEV